MKVLPDNPDADVLHVSANEIWNWLIDNIELRMNMAATNGRRHDAKMYFKIFRGRLQVQFKLKGKFYTFDATSGSQEWKAYAKQHNKS